MQGRDPEKSADRGSRLRTGEPIRVLIIDDSLTVRTVFSRMVEADRDMTVAGTASNAERAIVMLRRMEVDVILLDLEMPGMGGLEALPKLQETAQGAEILVVSSLTEDGAEHTLAAMSMGAAETMAKPRPGGFDEKYRASLLDKIRALGGRDPEARKAARSAPAGSATATSRMAERRKRPEVVAIGASTGGIHALGIVLRNLPPDFDLPIFVTQHLPANFMPVLARQVELASARRTVVADEGTPVLPGEILIASGNGHLVVKRRGSSVVTGLSHEIARSGCMPSVDPMLDSLSRCYDGHVLGVILSGMGRDGVEGAATLVEHGGSIIAQDQESSAVWGMPGAVTKAGLASAVLPPEELALAIRRSVGVPAWR